jgi:transcriptional regulator with XRE-family HTH domain
VINAEIVLARRTQCGLSQRQLAKRTGVSCMTIWRMENGSDTSDLPLSVLGRLADTLNVEPGALLRSSKSATCAPSTATCADSQRLSEAQLGHDAARLLRKIHRGDDIRRTMSQADRVLILPSMVNSGLVSISSAGATVSDVVAASLRPARVHGNASG